MIQRPEASWQKIDIYNFFPVPCIQFEQTVYDAVEADEKVEVCVVNCSDIADSVIKVHVFGPNDEKIPLGAAIASKLLCIQVDMYVHQHVHMFVS